jgi:hypothetical protein
MLATQPKLSRASMLQRSIYNFGQVLADRIVVKDRIKIQKAPRKLGAFFFSAPVAY